MKTSKQKQRYDLKASKLADHNTPFIQNAWYVVGESVELTDKQFERSILDTSLVFFRDAEGKATALQNRCCHRSFPLSEGKLENGNIRCGYHGLVFDADGICIEIPMAKEKPRGIQIRSFPVIEMAGLLWVWMGDERENPEQELPFKLWIDDPDNWDIFIGYLKVEGSYVHMHENLLDLSHLSYLHETTFGTPEYALAPIEINECEDGLFEVWRHVECCLPPIYAKPLGWEGKRVTRSSGSKYCAPGLHVNTGKFSPIEGDCNEECLPMVKVAQWLTPESHSSVHYWYAAARNFARNDKAVDEFMLAQQTAAFMEDVHAIGRIAQLQRDEEGNNDFFEIDIPSDKAGVAMRKHLKQLADAESTFQK